MPHAQPPAIGTPPPSAAGAPVPLGPEPARKPEIVRQLFSLLLSLCLGLFLADAIVSLADDSLSLWFGLHFLKAVRGVVGLFSFLLAIVVYVLMGLTPMIPKRLFLPIALINPLALLAAVPVTIYCYSRTQQVSWIFSVCQLALGLGILCGVQGGLKFRWPLVAESRLGSRGFSWLNLSGFLLVNVFVLLPAVVVYLVVFAALAVDHFSGGFLALRPGGFTVQVRKYVRSDGKTIQLVPMAHIGEADFYGQTRDPSPPTRSSSWRA